ncbi:MAG TPA: ectonucleotide pyrophosphatase/phosphodiesterase [Sphingobium sp.]|nr:ectonucleotide pyrophosphatase/phosphodiesterase [Sphingobium sp.]
MAAAAIAALLSACATQPATAPASPTPVVEARAPVTILIGIDGFRADYLDRGVTPVLSRLAAEGAQGAMRPSFPVKTFPNFYTLVTGLRPDRHGIVANRFEDPAHPGERFTQASQQSWWWDQAEPIWVAAERAGIRTAILYWPGANVAVRGVRPSDWHQFNMAVTGRQRVDAVIDWLRRPAATRPRLIGVYFDTIDTAGHKLGPGAKALDAPLAEIDALIGRLEAELAALGQPANLVIVADHGMGASSPSRQIRLDHIARAEDYRVIEQGPYAALEPMPGRDAQLAAALLRPHPHMQCWRRGGIPARLHYGANPRTPSFVCLPERGWMIASSPPAADAGKGEHGWDPDAPEMRALFLAHGPQIARRGALPPFDNVDVYPLLRRLIGLPPAHGIDGSAATLAP